MVITPGRILLGCHAMTYLIKVLSACLYMHFARANANYSECHVRSSACHVPPFGTC